MRARGERQSTELLVLQCPPSTVGEAKCRDGTRRSFCLSVTSWVSRWAYGPTLQLLRQLYTYNMYLFFVSKNLGIPWNTGAYPCRRPCLCGASRGADAGGEEAQGEGHSCAISECDGVLGQGLRALGGSGGDRAVEDDKEVVVVPHGGRPVV